MQLQQVLEPARGYLDTADTARKCISIYAVKYLLGGLRIPVAPGLANFRLYRLGRSQFTEYIERSVMLKNLSYAAYILIYSI